MKGDRIIGGEISSITLPLSSKNKSKVGMKVATNSQITTIQ